MDHLHFFCAQHSTCIIWLLIKFGLFNKAFYQINKQWGPALSRVNKGFYLSFFSLGKALALLTRSKITPSTDLLTTRPGGSSTQVSEQLLQKLNLASSWAAVLTTRRSLNLTFPIVDVISKTFSEDCSSHIPPLCLSCTKVDGIKRVCSASTQRKPYALVPHCFKMMPRGNYL